MSSLLFLSPSQVIGNKYQTYVKYCVEMDEAKAMDKLGLRRYCCRRMVLTHVELIDHLLDYNHNEKKTLIPAERGTGGGSSKSSQ